MRLWPVPVTKHDIALDVERVWWCAVLARFPLADVRRFGVDQAVTRTPHAPPFLWRVIVDCAHRDPEQLRPRASRLDTYAKYRATDWSSGRTRNWQLTFEVRDDVLRQLSP